MPSKDYNTYRCSDPQCDGAELVVVRATEEMIEASDAVSELKVMSEMFGIPIAVGTVGIGLCSSCSLTYYIAL